MTNQYKNNPAAYDWIPEIITSIDPKPKYHKEPPKSGVKGFKYRIYQEALGKAKGAVGSHIAKRQMEERADHGRLYSHIRHVEMKNAIADIKA